MKKPTKQSPLETSLAARKSEFLKAFSKVKFQGDACAAIGLSRRTVHRWRESDPEFAADYNEVNTELTEIYEKKLLQLGVEKDEVAAVIFALKCRNPEVYSERFKHEITTPKTDLIFSELLSLLKQRLPSTCPHCHTKMTMREDLARDLLALSERMEKSSKTA